MNELHLFAGAGGGILGGILLGHTTVCAVEIEPYCRKVLLQRQRDGILPKFPIWDNVTTFDGKPWRGKVDVVCGGFPCQDISVAGKGAGIDGERSGMWFHMARIISEVRPRFVFVENSPALTFRGLGRVLGDLSKLGFNAKWGVMGASDIGMQHDRKRIWIVADSNKGTFQSLGVSRRENQLQWQKKKRSENWIDFLVAHDGDAPPTWRRRGSANDSRPIMWRKSDGMANGVDRIAAIGNGQVPGVAALAFQILGGRLK